MKKKHRLLFTLLMAIVMMVMCPARMWADYDGTPVKPAVGDGSSNNPYQIATVANLFWFAGKVNGTLSGETAQTSANAKLVADIVVNDGTFDKETNTFTKSGESTTSTPVQWTPIAASKLSPYIGTFDGNGYVISGLYMSGLSENGLFINNNGTIKNVGLTNIFFVLPNNASSGSIACNNSGTIEYCYAIGNFVQESKALHGGICMKNFNYIANCYSAIKYKKADTDIEINGGICSYNQQNLEKPENKPTIKNCYTIHKLHSLDETSAPKGKWNSLHIVGNITDTLIQNGELAYMLNGSVDEYGEWSPGIGAANGWYQTLETDGFPVRRQDHGISYPYYDGCKLVGYTNDAQMAQSKQHVPHAYVNGICSICGGYQPAVYVTPANCESLGVKEAYNDTTYFQRYCYPLEMYAISNAGQLLWFKDREDEVSGVLTQDIVVNDGTFADDGTFTARGATEPSTPLAWKQKYSFGYSFNNTIKRACVLCGNGHSISGLFVESSNFISSLFCKMHCGYIYKLGIKSSYYKCDKEYGAGICKYNEGGVIEDCYMKDIYFGSTNSSERFSGLVDVNMCTIKNCYVKNLKRVGLNKGFLYGICCDNSSGNISNSYFEFGKNINFEDEKGDENYAKQLSTEKFENGEVAYLLNGQTDHKEWKPDNRGVWYQRIKPANAEVGNESYDDSPVLIKDGENNTVYYGYADCTNKLYSNTQLSSTPTDVHSFKNRKIGTPDYTTSLKPIVCDYCETATLQNHWVLRYSSNEDGILELIEDNGTYSTSKAIALTDENFFESIKVNFTTTNEALPTYTRTISDEWGTIILPFSFDTSDYPNLEFYKIDKVLDGKYVILSSLSDRPEDGVPYIFRRKDSSQPETIVFTANNKTLYPKLDIFKQIYGILRGYYYKESLNKSNSSGSTHYYFLYNDAFYNCNQLKDGQTVTILPFHCYLNVSASSTSYSKLMFMTDDETTSIQDPQFIIRNADDTVYNLNGQRLATPQKGINIINGKKVLVK